MTRKDFQLIADILQELNAPVDTVELVAEKLKASNPRFNESKFILAALNWE